MAVDAKCSIHALICDVTFEHHGEPRVQTNVRVGIIAAQNVIDVSAVVALSYVKTTPENCSDISNCQKLEPGAAQRVLYIRG